MSNVNSEEHSWCQAKKNSESHDIFDNIESGIRKCLSWWTVSGDTASWQSEHCLARKGTIYMSYREMSAKPCPTPTFRNNQHCSTPKAFINNAVYLPLSVSSVILLIFICKSLIISILDVLIFEIKNLHPRMYLPRMTGWVSRVYDS